MNADAGAPRDKAVNQAIEWAFDHTAGEAIFRGPDVVLVGDAEVLAAAVGRGIPALTEAIGWVDVDDERALMLRGPGDGRDGPWVWVLTSDDGPIACIDISPSLANIRSNGALDAGSIAIPSGRLVVGTPTSIAWRGAAVEPSGSRQVEMFYDVFIPGGLGDYLVVVRLPEPGSCDVVVLPGEIVGQVSYLSVELPRPPWLPTPRPLI